MAKQSKSRLSPLEEKMVASRFNRTIYCAICGGEIIFYAHSGQDPYSTGADVYRWEAANGVHRSCAVKDHAKRVAQMQGEMLD